VVNILRMDKIKIGVIGCGYWGPNLIRNFVEIPDSDVVAVADLDEERLSFIQSRFPQIKLTRDYYKRRSTSPMADELGG